MTGYENNLTFPKSSPVTINLESLLLLQQFTSVPSAFSGHIPSVVNDIVQLFVAHSTSFTVLVCVI